VRTDAGMVFVVFGRAVIAATLMRAPSLPLRPTGML